jgi:phospholipid-binding lipoprotein MlaA
MRRGRLGWALGCAAAALLGGCAEVPREPVARAAFQANHDPLEPLNRRTFAFNESIDRAIIKPVARGYRALLSSRARDAVRHFLDNLHEPVLLINDVLQGRLQAAATVGARFVVNSTAGIAGFREVASHNRLAPQTGDFGQTLSVWGFHEGPYLILPLLGPSSPRDGIGFGVDLYLDPFRYVARANDYPSAVGIGRTALDGIDQRERSIDALDEMQREAVDYYASFRSLFRQHRAAELRVGANAAKNNSPPADFYDDPGK